MKEKISEGLINDKNTASKVSAIMLLIAILPLPYGYYILLRWIVCISATFSVWVANELGNKSWLFLMVLIALLFNPIVPVHLDKGTWVIIDFIVAILFFASINKIKQKVENNNLFKD